MRERLAKVLAALITGLVVLMAAFFAHRRNPVAASVRSPGVESGAAAAPPTAPDPALVALGRTVFEEQACTRCHAAEGRGNPRLPLDGVGTRRAVSELPDWVTGTGAAREELGRSTARVKGAFTQLPREELDAVVAYLSSLR